MSLSAGSSGCDGTVRPLTHLCPSTSSFLGLPSAESTCSQPADMPVPGEPVFYLEPLSRIASESIPGFRYLLAGACSVP